MVPFVVLESEVVFHDKASTHIRLLTKVSEATTKVSTITVCPRYGKVDVVTVVVFRTIGSLAARCLTSRGVVGP